MLGKPGALICCKNSKFRKVVFTYTAAVIFFHLIILALILPDAVFLEGLANPVQVCTTLVLPEDSIFMNITLPDVFPLPVKFTDGTAGTYQQVMPCCSRNLLCSIYSTVGEKMFFL